MRRSGWPTFGAALALLCATGCSDEPHYVPIRLEGAASRVPNGEIRPTIVTNDVPSRIWRVSSQYFRRPFAVYALDDNRAIVLDRAHPFLHLIDTDRGVYLYPLVVPASDTAEPPRLDRMSPSPNDAREFVGYDFISGSLRTFRVGDGDTPLTQLRTVKLNLIESVDWPLWHKDGGLSVEPVRENALRARVSDSGDLETPTGVALIEAKPDWVPPGSWRDAMEGHTCANSDRSKIARTFQHMGLVMVLDSSGNRLPNSESDRFLQPQFEVRDQTGEVVFGGSTTASRIAYKGCGATNEHIFALFVGNRPRTSSRMPELRALQVHVYNWRGWLLGGFRVAREAVGLDVTPSGRLLLVLEGLPAVDLVAYEVPGKYR